MAKKRATTKSGTKPSSKPSRKRASRKPDATLQLLKIISGLAILVLLVVGAGILAKVWIDKPAEHAMVAVRPDDRPSRRPAGSTRKPPTARPQKPAPQTPDRPAVSMPEKPVTTAVPERPVYEVYPQTPPAKSMQPLAPLPGARTPIVAIIFDDIGYDRHMARRLMAMDVPLTFSMLPQAPFIREIFSDASAKGLEIMLHLPMEPNEYPDVKPGPAALLSRMSPDELIAQLNENLDAFSGIKGVNNHMGSRISESSDQMRQIFSILKKRGLYYIDSRTTAQTAAPASARLLQLPFAERDIFIDHFDDTAFIRSQLTKLVKRAQQQGYAVGIAHPHENTYQVLKAFLPQLKEQVTLVPASMVVQQVMVAAQAGGR